MTYRELKKRYKEIYQKLRDTGLPENYAHVTTRQTLIKELMQQGVSNSDAVYYIYKATQIKD